MIEEELRALFEQWYSDDGKHPKSIERSNNGGYVLMQAATSWTAWEACYLTLVKIDKV